MLSLGNFVFTCFQISNTENKDGLNILNGHDPISKVCKSEEPFKSHRPSAFRYDDSTTTFGCGWDPLTLGLRMSATLVTVAIACVSFYFTVIRKSKLVYVFAILLLIVAAGFGWFTYNDSAAISTSQKWCDKNLTGANFTTEPEKVTCVYGQLIAIPILDAFSAACWLGLTVFTILVEVDLPDFLKGSGGSGGSNKKSTIKKSLMDKEEGKEDVVFPDGPDEDEMKKKEEDEPLDSFNIDFDMQSNKRFPPVSKTDMQQSAEMNASASSSSSKDKKKAKVTASASVTVASGDIDFSQVESSTDNNKTNYPPKHEPPKSQQPPRPPVQQQQQQQQPQQPQQPPPPRPQKPSSVPKTQANGDFDFESYVPED